MNVALLVIDEIGFEPMSSTMRILSSPSVFEHADGVVRIIIETYLAPNKTFREVREMLDNDALNPLLEFSNAAREELRERHSAR